MLQTFVLVEVVGKGPYPRKFVIPLGEGACLDISASGLVTLIKYEERCKLCAGKKGVTYWYAQDESRSYACPVCNGGTQAAWDAAAKEWTAWRPY